MLAQHTVSPEYRQQGDEQAGCPHSCAQRARNARTKRPKPVLDRPRGIGAERRIKPAGRKEHGRQGKTSQDHQQPSQFQQAPLEEGPQGWRQE